MPASHLHHPPFSLDPGDDPLPCAADDAAPAFRSSTNFRLNADDRSAGDDRPQRRSLAPDRQLANAPPANWSP